MPHRWNFIHDEIGYNYRLSNLLAALGRAQLSRLDSMIARRIKLEQVDEAFAELRRGEHARSIIMFE